MIPRPLGSGPRLAVIALVIAALVHLATVLSLAHRTEDDAYRRVSALGHGTSAETFAAPADGRLFPYADPAMATRFCLFDLRRGPVLVRLAVTPLDFATLSVHGPTGEVLYALDNSAAIGGAITLLLTLPDKASVTEEAGGSLRVTLAEPVGFVAAEALAAMPSLGPMATASADGLACNPAHP